MSDSSSANVTIAITPMHRAEEGVLEAGEREGAQLFLVELVRADGEDAEVIVECRNERTAALAARVAAATMAALGLVEPAEHGDIQAYDDDTAAILADNPTPEVEAPSGEWGEVEDDEEESP